ncbi:L-threonylcarbamoyladenylate synthase [Actinomyces sp. oral taxon 170]|uniref:L-threonylcarbamoyladenylate synthase n=2 Tax=Actinomyces TaxID=1654 RepID=UPI000205BD25|nr:L-threonylcarbamoyladenylate synthase [Actinomyces sp. oral taxon 170]EGF55300.1 Sua5/YciO/YrdC/YwlC family protein [Actinomyces sp. oral taxon 170 str. F0386]
MRHVSQPPQPSASTAHSHLDALQPACEHLRAGGLVILPTDTVYGIGCNAADAGAVERLLASKGRGRQMPPPVLVAGPADLTGVVAQVPEAARILMEAFWPGPLTLILDADAALTWDLGETSGTIAIRMPDHELALDLLRRSGPLAVTSANPTGAPPATDAASARAAFPGRVRGVDAVGTEDILLLDGGATSGPVPSTIVTLAGAHACSPRILRKGVLSPADLERVAGVNVAEQTAQATHNKPEVGA